MIMHTRQSLFKNQHEHIDCDFLWFHIFTSVRYHLFQPLAALNLTKIYLIGKQVNWDLEGMSQE